MFIWSLFAATAALSAAPAPKVQPPLVEQLRSTRSTLVFTPTGIAGSGADVLKKAVASARIVAIGEDHATREIPALVSRLCQDNAADLSALVLESGRRATDRIRPMLSSANRVSRMTAFTRKYPDAVVFLDIRADNDMAAECVAAQPRLKVVGLDQEFLGSAGFLIDEILAQKLSPAARAAVEALKRSEIERQAVAAKSGNPGDLLLIGGSDEELAVAAKAVRSGGSAEAKAIMADLLKSREIYRTDGNAGNQERAALLKSNFAAQLPKSGKVLVKMGDWHLYRGYNPLNNRDLGNFIAEQADREGRPSLHILVLGAAGVHALYDGYRKPWRHERFKMTDDRDYGWLRPVLDARDGMASSDWAVFDLRPLRDRRIADVDVPWRRVLDGYDLLILIPELTPSANF